MKYQTTYTDDEYIMMGDEMENVVTTLENCALRYPNHTIDMRAGKILQEILNDKSCKTICCMAGHYLLGKITKPLFSYYGDNTNILTDTNGTELNYLHGADMLANDMGFDNKNHMAAWADENPNIWGNEWGGYLFAANVAYNIDREEFMTLGKIVNHLKGVSQRLRDPGKRIAIADQK